MAEAREQRQRKENNGKGESVMVEGERESLRGRSDNKRERTMVEGREPL